MKKYYIYGENQMFDTLSAAKYHIDIAYTAKERIKYLQGCQIVGVKNDETVTTTEIRIDEEGGFSFGRTIKY